MHTRNDQQATGQFSHAAEDLIEAHEVLLAEGAKRGRSLTSTAVDHIDWRGLVGGKKDIRSRMSAVMNADKDRLLAALMKPPGNSRTETDRMYIVDFMKTTKLFAAVAENSPSMLLHVASLVELRTYAPNQAVFDEGDVSYPYPNHNPDLLTFVPQHGEHFFIILEGEISITKKKKVGSNAMLSVEETVVLVRLFRGASFGEAALENAGVSDPSSLFHFLYFSSSSLTVSLLLSLFLTPRCSPCLVVRRD